VFGDCADERTMLPRKRKRNLELPSVKRRGRGYGAFCLGKHGVNSRERRRVGIKTNLRLHEAARMCSAEVMQDVIEPNRQTVRIAAR